LLQHLTPTTTLFPYTTLFRSKKKTMKTIIISATLLVTTFIGAQDTLVMKNGAQAVVRVLELSPDFVKYTNWSRPDETPRYMEGEDRKSTRLNSSHLGISYAVF